MTSSRPRTGRVAIALGSRNVQSNEEIIKLAQAAESLGYEAAFSGESWGRDLVTILTMVALNTKRIKIGTSIAGVWARTPALMAQTAASLDSISGGRLILGLGTGNLSLVQGWHGEPASRPTRRTREYVEIVRMILRGERLKYDGQIFKIDGQFQLAFRGPRDHIPIYIGSAGPKMTELAGEIGDGWMPTHSDIFQFHVMKEDFVKGCRRAGRDPDTIDVIPSIPAWVTDDVEFARSKFREHRAMYVGGLSDRYYQLMGRFGFKDEAERIRAAWAGGDRKAAAAAVSDAMVDHFSIIGTPEHCRKQLEACWAAGMHMPRISMFESMPTKDMYRTLEALAPR
ncbi:MAG: LLM class flavin-dependent oxidoreductase [Chloroflexi bacterium]|nr:LLM class flavin-dependent oxidoreductase [Chloroflexota bacterium]